MICAVWFAIIIGRWARYIVLGVINILGGWTDGRTKMWKKFLFPLRKTSRFVVFVLYKLSKVPDVNLKKKRKERNSLCRGDLKSIALLCSSSDKFSKALSLIFALIKIVVNSK